MLGQKRKYKHLCEPKQRTSLADDAVLAAQSNCMLYNCTKYEKFFHYYTACGVLVNEHGIVEMCKRKRQARKSRSQQSPYQLVYKHSKAPVFLDVCDESSYTVGTDSKQECDLDMLIDDNALRVAVSETSRHAAEIGESLDAYQLHNKRKDKVAEVTSDDSDALADAVSADEFGDAVDAERPRQFLAANLVDLVLLNTSLSEYIAVYLVPVPELRRTRVQFYWCVRETKIPYSPLVARWMLQNYVDRCGPLESVDCTERPVPSTRQTLVDLQRIVQGIAQRRRSREAENAANEIQTESPDSNQSIRNDWEAFRRDNAAAGIDLPTVEQWLQRYAASRTEQNSNRTSGGPLYATSTQARTLAHIEALTVNENHRSAADSRASSTQTDKAANRQTLSEHCYAAGFQVRKAFYGAFRDDSLCTTTEYQRYCKKHGLRSAHHDVFSSTREFPAHSTATLYDFSFFIEDLRQYCAAEVIDARPTPQTVCDRDGSICRRNMLRFECALTDSDMVLLDQDIQLALKRAGLVTMPCAEGNDHTSGLDYNFAEPRIDEQCKYSLVDNCRQSDVQLCLGTLLSFVARLEIERIEPYELEPPVLDTVVEIHDKLRNANSFVADWHSDKNANRDVGPGTNELFLSHQQSLLLKWIRSREDATLAIKERRILRELLIANTGWRYCVASGEMRYEPNDGDVDADEPSGYSPIQHMKRQWERANKRRRLHSSRMSSRPPKPATPPPSDAALGQECADEALFTVETFNRNHRHQFEAQLHSVDSQRRRYEETDEIYNVLLLSGGAASGKRTVVMAQVLYNLSPTWRYLVECTESSPRKALSKLAKLDKRTGSRRTTAPLRSISKQYQSLRKAYFEHTKLARDYRYSHADTNVQLSRVSLLHQLHMLWQMHIRERLFLNPADLEDGEVCNDGVNLLLRRLLDEVITRFDHNERVDLQTTANELWYSFALLRTHAKLSMDRGVVGTATNPSEEIEQAVRTARTRRQLVDQFEPSRLKNSNLVSRATLIVCPSNEMDHWLQSLQPFGVDLDAADETCSMLANQWYFVGSDCAKEPIDAAVYCMRTIEDWQSFSVARLLASDVILVSYECLSHVTTANALYLRSFCNNVTALRSAEYCDVTWMRCVRQHMSIVQSTPCINLLKTPAEVAQLANDKQEAYTALEQIPLEAILWQRVVLANYDSYCRHVSLQPRPKRNTKFARVNGFLQTLRCMRRIIVSSETHTTQSLNNWFLPSFNAVNLVSTVVAEPMTPACLESYRRRWRHPYGERVSSKLVAHTHPHLMRCYARQCCSLTLDKPHQLRRNLAPMHHRQTLSARASTSSFFVARDVEHSVVPLRENGASVTAEQLQNLTILMNMTQQLQALHRCNDSGVYSGKISSAAYFSNIGAQSTMDMYKGIVGFRSPAQLLERDHFTDTAEAVHSNSAISGAQRCAPPTHIFVDQSRDLVRFVRLLDKQDAISWRDFTFSRNAHLSPDDNSDVQSVALLKASYRQLLHSVSHAPQLLPVVNDQLTELYLYRVGRLCSSLTRSTSDAPEYPYSTRNSAEVLSRATVHSDIIEAGESTIAEQRPRSSANDTAATSTDSSRPSDRSNLPERTESVGEENGHEEQPSLLERWYRSMHTNYVQRNRRRLQSRFTAHHPGFGIPNLTCLNDFRAPHRRLRQDALEEADKKAHRDLMLYSLPTKLSEEMDLLVMFGQTARPDFGTATVSSCEMGNMRLPVHRLEMLNGDAARAAGYRHAQVATVDRCLLAICDSALNADYATMHEALAYAQQYRAKFNEKLAARDTLRALNDPEFYIDSSARLSGADEVLYGRSAPQQMQRLHRRGLCADREKLLAEFLCSFAFGLCHFLYQCGGDDLDEYLCKTTFPLTADAEDEESSEAGSNSAINANGGDGEQSQSPRRAGTQIRLPMTEAMRQSIASRVTLQQSPTESVADVSTAIDRQEKQLSKIVRRYIVTEQNLLFERRCADWMLVSFVRDLDRFVAAFNVHSFMQRVPLLCTLSDQCGTANESQRTDAQRQFAQRHQFYAGKAEMYAGSAAELTNAELSSEQLRKLSAFHLEHYDRTLAPVIEMLLYSGRIHGYLKSNPSPELRRLFSDVESDEQEQQMLLRRVVGGVKTAAPTYLVNMIAKFRYETRWIARDLAFIRKQRQRTMAAVPALARLRSLLTEQRRSQSTNDDGADSDDEMFECSLCMGSLLEADNVALYPCGHMCCYSCHEQCNQKMYQPMVEENTVQVGIATPGLQCFLCRYLLQFNEKVIKTTLLDAVERAVVNTQPSSTTALTSSMDELLNNFDATLQRTVWHNGDSAASSEDEGQLNLPEVEHISPSNNEFAQLDTPPPSIPITEVVSSEDEASSVDILPEPLGCSNSLSAGKDDSVVEPSQQAYFTKCDAVVSQLRDQLLSFADKNDYSASLRTIVVVSNYERCLDTIQKNLRALLADAGADDRLRQLFVQYDWLPIPIDEQSSFEDFVCDEAHLQAMVPVIFYWYHMDLNYELDEGACFQKLRCMPNVDAVVFVETPMVRLVDDRSSRLLAVELEQRLLSKFVHEFSRKRHRISVHRFVLDYGTSEVVDKKAEANQSVDRHWYNQTRWYDAPECPTK